MKITKRGSLVVVIFFIVVPLLVDAVLAFFTRNAFGISLFLFSAYLRCSPLYISYLAIASVVLWLVAKWRKSKQCSVTGFEFEAFEKQKNANHKQ